MTIISRPSRARPAPLAALVHRLTRLWCPVPLALAGVLAAGLTLRLVFFYGLVNVDPFAYADSAIGIARAQKTFDPDFVGNLYFTQYIRLALTVPAAILYRVFGPSDATSTAVPIAAALGTSLVCFAMARRVAGDMGAVIAAALCAVFPLSVANSTQFLPDTMMMFFASLSSWLFIRALEDEMTRRKRIALYFAAGLAFGGCFYARQTAVALVPPLGVILVVRAWPARQVPWEILAAPAGALAVIAAANALLMPLGAGPLEDLRVTINEGRGSAPGALRYTDVDWSYARTVAADPMWWPFTLIVAAGFALLVAHHGWRRTFTGPAMPLIVLALGEYLYFEFLMRLPGLYTWWKEPRYALAMTVPAFAVGGAGLGAWFDGMRRDVRPVTGLYIAGVLLFATAWSVGELREDHAFWETNRVDALAREIAAALDRRPDRPVYVNNEDLARPLAFRLGLDDASTYDRAHDRGRLRNRFDADGLSQVEPDSYVVLRPLDEYWSAPAVATSWWEKIVAFPGEATVYHVPAQPPPAEQLRNLDPPLAIGSLQVTLAGIFPYFVLPGHLVAVEFEFASPAAEEALLEATVACPGEPGTPATVRVPAGAESVRFELQAAVGASATSRECGVYLGPAGAPGTLGPPVTVPGFVTDQPEQRFTVVPPSEGGWYSTFQPFFSGGGAVVAVAPFAPLVIPMPALPAGDYWLDLAVYDYGSGPNTVAIDLNGVDATVTWGGKSEGVTHVVVPVRTTREGHDLTLTVRDRGQDAITIDSVTLITVDPAILR